MVSVLGAGLLVGTALSVIIPEGVRSLLSMPHEESKTSKKNFLFILCAKFYFFGWANFLLSAIGAFTYANILNEFQFQAQYQNQVARNQSLI